MTNLTKYNNSVLDLGQFSGSKDDLAGLIQECTATRAPPLTPADFRMALSTKAFTSKKADEDMVAKLYESTFATQFGQATLLDYSKLSWGGGEAATLAKVLGSGALASLAGLRLNSNQIGDAGISALASAVSKGALDNLKVCWRSTALSPCPETLHALSTESDPEHLFDVPYTDASS